MIPRISVIVPSYNPSTVFDECLESLAVASRELPGQVEVLVIDDFSDKPFRSRVQSHGFRYERMPHRSGAGATRNRGAQLAAGNILLFVDYDIVVPPDSLKMVLDHFDTDPELAALTAQSTISNGGRGFFNSYKCLFVYNLFKRTPRQVCYLWTSFAAIRADAFHRAGGFPTHYQYAGWEDVEMGLRLASMGGRIINSDRIEVTHKHYYDLASLIKNDWKRSADYMKVLLRNRAVIRRLSRAGQPLPHHERLAVPFSVLLFLDLFLAGLSFSGFLPHWLGLGCVLFAPFLLFIFVLSVRDSLVLAWRNHGPLFAAKILLTCLILSNVYALAAFKGMIAYLFGRVSEAGGA